MRRRVRGVLVVLALLQIIPAATILTLRWVDPPWTAFMMRTWWLARSSGHDSHIDHHWVDLDDMASCMPLAVVAAEDQTFPWHRGFALLSLRRAMVSNLNRDGHGIRGGSTISQQTAKNLFLWPSRSYSRKAIEGYLTLWLELLWPKRRILGVYLNVAQFGDRVFGVGAAAKHFFHTTADRLTPYQCAALAAVLPSPRQYNAAAPSAYVRRRIRWIRQQMRQLGGNYLLSVTVSK